MKIEKRAGGIERRILIGMITDNVALARIASKWEDEPFSNRWCNIIGEWCVKYHNDYGDAPKKSIEGLYESWAATAQDEESAKLIENFLDSLSGEYVKLAKRSNSQYIIDEAAKHFTKVKVRKTVDTAGGHLDTGDVSKATETLSSFRPIEMGENEAIDIFANKEAFKEAFETKSTCIIKYPEALGVFFATALERDGFIAIMAPEKTAKSWILLDMGYRAARQGRRVAYFQVGDISKQQLIRRIAKRIAGRPYNPKTVKIPTYIKPDLEAESGVELTFEDRVFTRELSWKTAWRACEAFVGKIGTSDYFKLSCHPNNSITVAGIESILVRWKRDLGWVPDVIVIDYADVLASLNGKMETRDQTNLTWTKLRSLSQAWHCLVVTATQTDAASYDGELITRSNFSNDKRKLSHVTGMIGVNQKIHERALDVRRFNWVALREGEFDETQCCYVAGCLDVGNPCVKSTF